MSDTANVGGIEYVASIDLTEFVKNQRQIERGLDETAASGSKLEAKFNQITKAIGAYSAALYVVAQSDAYSKLTSQLTLATDSTKDLNKAQEAVRQIAQESQTEIAGVGTLYARVSTATKELGVSQSGVADITRAVALSMKVSGATAQESASATLQLAQAFASGALRGEEFNAVNEAAPRLMRALADGIGVPVGALRGLAEQGRITSAVMAQALPRALGELEGEAAKIQTVSGAFQQLRNEVLLFIGEQTQSSGAATLLARSITTLASNIDTLAAAALGFAATKLAKTLLDVSINTAQSAKATIDSVVAQQAARAASIADAEAKVASMAATQAGILVAREETVAKLASANAALQAAQSQAVAARSAGALSFAIAALREAELAAAAATKARSAAVAELAILGQQQARVSAAMTAAQASLNTAMSAAGPVASLVGRAIGFLGGPIGVITTLLGVGATAWALWGNSATDSERKASGAVERSTDEIVASLDKQITKLRERNSLASAGMAGIAKQESDAANRLAELQGQINDLMAGKGLNGGPQLPEEARVALLQQLLSQYGELAGKVREVGDLQDKLNAAGQSSKLAEWMSKYATNAERARVEIQKAKDELGSAFTPDLEQRIQQKFTPDKKPKQDGFDSEAYLSALKQANMQGLALIDEREQAALAVAQKHYGEGELDKAKFEAAKTEIEAKAQADRDKLWQQVQDAQKAAEQDELRRKRETLAQEIEAEKRAQAEKQQGRDFATGIIAEQDPVAKLQFELQAKSALLAQYAEQDMANLTLYAQAKVALEQQTQAQIVAAVQARHDAENQLMSAQLTNYSNLFGAMADMTGAFAGKQSAAYKAMFAVSKAFAIADAIMKIQQGIANAMSLPWPANLAAAASTAAAAAGIVSTIKSTSFGGGRQYGGPVNAGTMYRVNETGKPEMYTAASGEQYMLPNKSGKVTPANKVGGSEAQQPSFSFGDMHLNLQGVPMPNGMFAINPGDLADAIRRAQRDMFFTGRL